MSTAWQRMTQTQRDPSATCNSISARRTWQVGPQFEGAGWRWLCDLTSDTDLPRRLVRGCVMHMRRESKPKTLRVSGLWSCGAVGGQPASRSRMGKVSSLECPGSQLRLLRGRGRGPGSNRSASLPGGQLEHEEIPCSDGQGYGTSKKLGCLSIRTFGPRVW